MWSLQGHRAELYAARVAKCLAAFEGREKVYVDDLKKAVKFLFIDLQINFVVIYLVPPFCDIVQHLFRTTPIVLRAVNKGFLCSAFPTFSQWATKQREGI